ncbi:transcription antitermination regulator [Mycobacterium avium subsp. hominissuis 10-4249]|nr:transcription antitermination regulator [Mycobacterium avium subsp. hominissuis 10-4249]
MPPDGSGGDVMREASTTIVTQLVELVTSLERENSDTAAGLHELIDNGVHHVTGSQYAGITLAEKSKSVNSVAATHRYPMVLDAIQNKYGEGPCLAAAWEHHVMHIADLAAEQRWQRYRRHALEQTPIRSILSFELFVDRTSMAALNFYADAPHAFTEESVELGTVYATHIALAWSMMRRQDQFRSALASRDIIGQAKGVIMERFDLDAVEAFELLTRLSQQSNTRVVDIAAALIDSEHPLKQRRR